jgi:hypothetical protein
MSSIFHPLGWAAGPWGLPHESRGNDQHWWGADVLVFYEPPCVTGCEKSLRQTPNTKSSTQIDALYAIAEPRGYILLPPDFAISRARKTFPQPGQHAVGPCSVCEQSLPLPDGRGSERVRHANEFAATGTSGVGLKGLVSMPARERSAFPKQQAEACATGRNIIAIRGVGPAYRLNLFNVRLPHARAWRPGCLTEQLRRRHRWHRS